MKRILFFAAAMMLLSHTFFSCKKAADKKAEDYIIEIMTDGRWYMYNYNEAGIDQTWEFDGYEFQFYDNGKVDGIRGTSVTTGTWSGDLANISIIANFSSAGEPLNKLNNTWKITDSYTNAVFAEARFGTALNKIQLVKK